MNDLKIYLPSLYNDVLEMDMLLEAENVILGSVEHEVDNTTKDQFIQTATLYGIGLFEEVLGIIPDLSTESIEFRRMRLLSRMSTNPPFTEEFLDQHLEQIIGAGNYTIAVYPATYTVEVRILIPARTFFAEAQLLMLDVVPANMIMDISIQYNSYADLAPYTYAQLAALTYYDMKEEVLP